MEMTIRLTGKVEEKHKRITVHVHVCNPTHPLHTGKTGTCKVFNCILLCAYCKVPEIAAKSNTAYCKSIDTCTCTPYLQYKCSFYRKGFAEGGGGITVLLIILAVHPDRLIPVLLFQEIFLLMHFSLKTVMRISMRAKRGRNTRIAERTWRLSQLTRSVTLSV